MNAPEHPCLVFTLYGEPHEAHEWWYTSWGGGHQMWQGFDPKVHVEEAARERDLKQWYCPGRE